ncbi:MAG: AlpA family phage regulatory protein [Methylocella sp.]
MYINYRWLVDNGVMPNRTTLARSIEKFDFPAPLELGKNRIAWNRDEVEAWLASRPRRGPKHDKPIAAAPLETARA